MDKRRLSRLLLSIGTLVATSLVGSWLLGIRVTELAELVRSRQGLAGIGEAAAQDVYQTLQAVKNICFGLGLVVGVVGGVFIGAVATRTGARRIGAGHQEFYQGRARVNHVDEVSRSEDFR